MNTCTSRFRLSRPVPAFLAAMVVGTAVWLPAARAGAQCVGDCNGDGSVGINELILGVNIALGSQPTSACTAFQDGSGMVTIAQLIKGVNDALAMCPATPTVTVGTPPPTEVVDTPTETSTPVPTVTPGGTPVCGNGIIEPGETCDDGNTMDGDNCPADCVIHDCQFTQTTLDVDTVMQLPDGVTPGVLQIFLRYPDGVVGLPGHGPDAINVITNLPDDAFTTTVNDVDYGLTLIVLGPSGLTLGTSPSGLLATTTFTVCGGATAPPASAFHCTVENATTVDNTDVTANSSCSVVLP